jgi:hypothetical protein
MGSNPLALLLLLLDLSTCKVADPHSSNADPEPHFQNNNKFGSGFCGSRLKQTSDYPTQTDAKTYLHRKKIVKHFRTFLTEPFFKIKTQTLRSRSSKPILI